MEAAALVQQARASAGLSQAELAARVGTTQSAIARLERAGSNPSVGHLTRVVAATGQRLRVDLDDRQEQLGEGQVREHMRMSPADRLRVHDASRQNTVEFAMTARLVEE